MKRESMKEKAHFLYPWLDKNQTLQKNQSAHNLTSGLTVSVLSLCKLLYTFRFCNSALQYFQRWLYVIFLLCHVLEICHNMQPMSLRNRCSYENCLSLSFFSLGFFFIRDLFFFFLTNLHLRVICSLHNKSLQSISMITNMIKIIPCTVQPIIWVKAAL